MTLTYQIKEKEKKKKTHNNYKLKMLTGSQTAADLALAVPTLKKITMPSYA